jgi:hypothetical protein
MSDCCQAELDEMNQIEKCSIFTTLIYSSSESSL